ncbi:SAM domain family protein [Hordeum vulgare]|nr:SAM domain family protein [Hordeum vulgare]
MASTAKVTITLGRSGQVVKRRTISDMGNDDEVPVSGRKRPVRERLGNNVADSDLYGSQQSNKRRQTESSSSQLGDDGLARQIGRDDLRLKLMRKGLTQKSNSEAEQNGVDLREKLSRKSKKLQGYEARRGDPESRSSYDEGEIPESGSGYGSRGRVPESRASTLVSQVPSSRSADGLFKLESSGKPYPSWTADCLRYTSPDKLPSVRRDMTPPRSVRRGMSPPRAIRRGMSPPISGRRGMSPPRSARRGMSPPRNVRGGMSPPRTRSVQRGMSPPRSVRRGMSPPRTYDHITRSSSHITRDAADTLRTHQPYEDSSTMGIDRGQQTNGITPSGRRPTSPVLKEIPSTVTGLLNSMGLEKYVVLFQAEEVDMAALSQMKDSDLKDMGVPMVVFVIQLLAALHDIHSDFLALRPQEEDTPCGGALRKTTAQMSSMCPGTLEHLLGNAFLSV